MGIDFGSALMLGEEYSNLDIEIPEEFEDDLWEYFYSLGMDCASPWFDAGVEECFVGYSLSGFSIFDEESLEDIREKSKRFEELFGVKAIVQGCADIT